MSNKTQRLKQQVPGFVSGTDIMASIYDAQGIQLDDLVEYNEDVLNQLFIETATWGLSHWEEFCGLPVLINQDVKIRRAKIRAHFTSFGTVNKAAILKIAKDFGFVGVDVVEDYAPYIVKLMFDNSAIGQQVNIVDLLATLRRMCPAHIDFMYIFLFKSWKDIQDNNMTFDKLDAYQWRDYTVDFDTCNITSPIVRFKLWADGDLFSMLGFNYNFNRLDTYFQSHSHNGTDSKKLNAARINYVNSETALPSNTFKGAIDRLNGLMDYTGDGQDKERMKALWGYTGANEWELLNQHMYQVQQDILDSIRDRGVMVHTSSPIELIAGYVENVFTGLQPTGTARPHHVRKGKTFISEGGVLTGTLENIPGLVIGTKDIPLNGFGMGNSIHAEPNLVPETIKEGIEIFGVEGTAPNSPYPDRKLIDESKYEVLTSEQVVTYKNVVPEGFICYNLDGSDNSVVGGEGYANLKRDIYYNIEEICAAAGIAFNNNLKVTHIIDENHIVIQDVVNKNNSYFIQLPFMSLPLGYNAVKILKQRNKECVAVDRITLSQKPFGDVMSRVYLIGFTDCISIIDSYAKALFPDIALNQEHALKPNTAKIIETANNGSTDIKLKVVYASTHNNVDYLCSIVAGGSTSSTVMKKAKDFVRDNININDTNIKIRCVNHTKQRKDSDAEGFNDRKIMLVIANSTYSYLLRLHDDDMFTVIDRKSSPFGYGQDKIYSLEKDSFNSNFVNDEQGTNWTVTYIDTASYDNPGLMATCSCDNNFETLTSLGITSYHNGRPHYSNYPKVCNDFSIRGIHRYKNTSDTGSFFSDFYQVSKQISIKIKLK